MANPEHLAILKQGVEVWNQWRKDRPEIEPDLKGANLKNLNLLEQKGQKYNIDETTSEFIVAKEAFEHIKQDRNLAERIFSALEKGSAAWLMSKVVNPSASFLVAALEEWQKNKQ